MVKPLIKRIYEKFTPYVQVLGWAVVVIPVLYTASNTVDKVLAYDNRLSALEVAQLAYKNKLDALDNKLEDLMDFWQVPHKKSRATETP